MLRLLADENLNNRIIQGARRRNPGLDLVTAVDVGLGGLTDDHVLAWSALEQRIIITHDERTMLGLAYARVRTGLPMPGVYHISADAPVGAAIDELLVLAECSFPEEWVSMIRHFPIL